MPNKTMEKEFVPYELALRLGSLGFDEPCIAWYVSKSYGLEYGKVIKPDLIKEAVLAPLYQQAFRWFRDKLKDSALEPYDMVKHYAYNMKVSWEEAEVACIEKLIEIVEQK